MPETGYLEVTPATYTARLVAPNANDCSAALGGLPDVAGIAAEADVSYMVAAVGMLAPEGTDQPFRVTVFVDDNEPEDDAKGVRPLHPRVTGHAGGRRRHRAAGVAPSALSRSAMLGTMPPKLDEIFDAARATLEARRQKALARVNEIRAALDAYAEAVELEMAAAAANQPGADRPVRHSTSAAARALLELVTDLPELQQAGAAPSEPPVNPPGASMKELLAADTSSGPRRPRIDAHAGPEARALWDELKALEAEDLPAPLFRATAAELAARARRLQERGDNAELLPERVIKALTALAGERGAGRIHGLARYHEGDWDELARKARAERKRLEAGGQALLTAKMPLLSTQSAAKPRAARKHDHGHEDDTELEESGSYPALRQAAAERPVVLAGGTVKPSKLDALQKRFGFDIEWDETDTHGSKGMRSLEGRILDGNIAALVILEGLGSHKHFEPLVAAARQTGTPLAYGDTAGTAALRRAFAEIEHKLAGHR